MKLRVFVSSRTRLFIRPFPTVAHREIEGCTGRAGVKWKGGEGVVARLLIPNGSRIVR